MPEPRIRVEMGFKANVGNYQSLDVRIALEDDVRESDRERNPAKNGVDAALERVYTYVEAELERRLEETKRAVKEVT